MWDGLKENYNLDIIENMAINYSAMDEWKKFISDYVIPLRDSAEALVDYWNYLKGKIEGVEVDEIGDDLKPILLGGVDEEGNYLEDSVAKFYKDFFGVSLNVELPKYVSAVKIKKELQKGIKGVIESLEEKEIPRNYTDETWEQYYDRMLSIGLYRTEEEYKKEWLNERGPVIRFFKDIALQTNKILDKSKTKGLINGELITQTKSADNDMLVREPNEVIELIKEFYNRCAEVTPLYNGHTLFILTTKTGRAPFSQKSIYTPCFHMKC